MILTRRTRKYFQLASDQHGKDLVESRRSDLLIVRFPSQSEGTATIRTRKFMTNRLLQRKQMVSVDRVRVVLAPRPPSFKSTPLETKLAPSTARDVADLRGRPREADKRTFGWVA